MNSREFAEFWRLAIELNMDMEPLMSECFVRPKVTPTFDSFVSRLEQRSPLAAAGIRILILKSSSPTCGANPKVDLSQKTSSQTEKVNFDAKVVEQTKSRKVKLSPGTTMIQRFDLAKKVTSVKPCLRNAVTKLASTYEGIGHNKTLHSSGCTICAPFLCKGNSSGILPKSLVKCVLAAHKTGLSIPSRADIINRFLQHRIASPSVSTRLRAGKRESPTLLVKPCSRPGQRDGITDVFMDSSDEMAVDAEADNHHVTMVGGNGRRHRIDVNLTDDDLRLKEGRQLSDHRRTYDVLQTEGAAARLKDSIAQLVELRMGRLNKRKASM